jgi:hypothetical protein
MVDALLHEIPEWPATPDYWGGAASVYVILFPARRYDDIAIAASPHHLLCVTSN